MAAELVTSGAPCPPAEPRTFATGAVARPFLPRRRTARVAEGGERPSGAPPTQRSTSLGNARAGAGGGGGEYTLHERRLALGVGRAVGGVRAREAALELAILPRGSGVGAQVVAKAKVRGVGGAVDDDRIDVVALLAGRPRKRLAARTPRLPSWR
jgi:hypothetical protein